MANPAVINLNEWQWVKIASATLAVTLTRLKSNVNYFWTYRMVGGDPPAPLILGQKPDEAVRLFELSNIKSIESAGQIDVYIYCANSDSDSEDTGKIRVDEGVGLGSAGQADTIKISSDQYFTIPNGVATTLQVAVTGVDEFSFIRSITVVDPSTFSIGDLVLISNPDSAYAGEVLAVSGNIITLDEPLNFNYPIAETSVLSNSKDMNVDGSVTPVVFRAYRPENLRFPKINICRLMIECLSVNPVDLSKFCDIEGGITNGLALRQIFPTSLGRGIVNQWNVKTNSDLKLLAYDWDAASATNPNQGQNGFHWRYSLGGESKHDNIETILEDGELQYVVQDNLTPVQKLTAIYGGNFEL